MKHNLWDVDVVYLQIEHAQFSQLGADYLCPQESKSPQDLIISRAFTNFLSVISRGLKNMKIFDSFFFYHPTVRAFKLFENRNKKTRTQYIFFHLDTIS